MNENELNALREDVGTLYAKFLALESKVSALTDCFLGVTACLEMPNPKFAEEVKAEFYDQWGEFLMKEFERMRVPLWAIGQVRGELGPYFDYIKKRLDEALEDVPPSS